MSALQRPMAHPASGLRAWRESDEEGRFVAIAAVFGRHGGMLTAADANRLALLRSTRAGSELARQISMRELIWLTGHGRIWLPLFQFDPQTMSVRDEVLAVTAELRHVFDEWDIGSWLVERNSWLGNRAPVAVIDENPTWVLEAARADRFIAAG
jgi:hypothetical protein